MPRLWKSDSTFLQSPRQEHRAQPSLGGAPKTASGQCYPCVAVALHLIASHRKCGSVVHECRTGLGGTHMRSVSRKVERKNSWTSSPYTRHSHADTRHSHADTRHSHADTRLSHADMRHTLSATTGTRRCAHVRLNGMSCSLECLDVRRHFRQCKCDPTVQVDQREAARLPKPKSPPTHCDRTYYAVGR